LARALDRRPAQRARRARGHARTLIARAGMRGAVSPPAALAVPVTTGAGEPLPARDPILVITFCVILATLAFQGLTLPALMRVLHVRDDGSEADEELHARLAAATAALERIDELGGVGWVRPGTLGRMRGAFEWRQRRFAARAGKIEDDGYEEDSRLEIPPDGRAGAPGGRATTD
jgi:CPA1 family monovalent cation:H+ antiporter